MAGILKNQLVKRLASFTKGLSVDKIDLDILSGRGYLDNLELDEQFMTSVLELPVWLCFTKILCSKIRLKVSFTKLKSEPIKIIIDTVYVEAEASKLTDRKDVNVQQKLADAGLSANGPTSYGYIEQVIDGMHITVSTIRLTLNLRHHYLSTELSGVELVSTNRKWRADDLRKTRAYVTPGREEVLVYKMLTVNHAKFEFFDKSSSHSGSAPPLKFNFNMIHLLITMKKIVATNEVSSACLKLILDDILLVFTPSQLQILLAFSKELSEVIELSAPPVHVPSNTPVRVQQPTKSSFLQRFSRQQEEEESDDTVVEFVTDNILETSYHLKTGTIDILLCDDNASQNAGSLQFRFEVVQLELYPHRTSNASRRHWTVPFQYVKDAQQYAADMLGDYVESTNGATLQNIYEMVIVLRCEHFQLLPVMGITKRQVLGPLLFSDKKKFGISDAEPALVVTIATYYGESCDSTVPPQNIYVHLNPTEINFDEATMWWLREFISSTMTDDFKLMLTDISKEESTSNYKIKTNLVLPHVTIPLTNISDSDDTGHIKGLQFWFSKLIISNLSNSLYLPLLAQIQECLENPLMYGSTNFPNHSSDEGNIPVFPNSELLPGIIEELTRHDRIKHELQEEKLRQRRNLTTSPVSPPSPFTTRTSPERPGTPESSHSRRSSVSSVQLSESLSGSPLANIIELFPLLRNMVLSFHFESFSADFLYSTDGEAGEKYRSRKFISDVPLQMWLIEESSSKNEVLTPQVNGHRKLTRNTLKRQETLTHDPTDYLIMLKCTKSVHCTLDREQYLFLLHLQQEVQSFVEKIILSVTQIFTSKVQESACFKLLATVEHLMVDINLPVVRSGPTGCLASDTSSMPDTASTCLSHLSSPCCSSRHSVSEEILLLEPTKSETQLDQRPVLNWVALSRSDSNIASLSERLSLQSEDDSISITSITNELNPLAKGDSKETLLKFIMRVNKRKETSSVACQTAPVASLVASNYQEMHRLPNSLASVLDKDLRNQLQLHCGSVSLVLQSSRDVITKVVCQRIIVSDEEFETKPRHFPFNRWRGKSNDPQILVRFVIRDVPISSAVAGADSTHTLHTTTSADVISLKHDADDLTETCSDVGSVPEVEMSCDVVASHVTTSLRDVTLESLAVFFQPDPTLPSQPMTLNCEVRDCEAVLDVNGTSQKICVPSLKLGLTEDESWIVGEQSSELEQLRRENRELKEKLKLLGAEI